MLNKEVRKQLALRVVNRKERYPSDELVNI